VVLVHTFIDKYRSCVTCTLSILLSLSMRCLGAMLVQFSDIVGELENWKDGRAVILRGAGGTFCSGGDLKMAKALVASSKFTAMCNFMQDALTRFYRLPLLSVAFVEGLLLDMRSISTSQSAQKQIALLLR